MRTIAALLIAGFLATTLQSSASAQSIEGIVLNGKVNIPFVPRTGGTVYLHLTIRTPRIVMPDRKPLNLSVVLDRSGSMGDQRKMEYAKAALTSLVRQLTRKDILSLVIYDDVVEVLRPAKKVRGKHEILRLVDEVYARGSTNLGGGMIEGFRQVSRHASRHYTNRVILLSDGLANQGITDPTHLNRIARKHLGRSISLTTMGVGLDYNENLMVGLAESGGGSYYFIESPHSLASIMEREFSAMSTIVAQNAILELDLGPGVRLRDAIGHAWKADGKRCEITLGDLYADDTRELALELDLDAGSGQQTIASGRLEFESDGASLKGRPTFRTSVEYTADAAAVEKHRDMEVQAKADVAVSTRKVQKAMEALDEGRADDAQRELNEAQEFLLQSPAASAAGTRDFIGKQRSRLEEFEEMVRDSTDDPRRAKKAIQYDNYRIQKNKE